MSLEKNLHFNKYLLFIAFLCYIVFSFSFRILNAEPTDGFYSAKVKDISDRAYEPALIELLDNAKESIIMSMYIIKPQEEGPVSLLIKDLEEALDRNVSVEIYLNTKFKSKKQRKTAFEKPFNNLREKGAKIYPITHATRLHDKLIIVDNRYVVEGSTNWSISALKDNFESSVLIDSPELAKHKLIRLRRLPLEGGETNNLPELKKTRRIGDIPENITISLNKKLLTNKHLFPRMLSKHDNRAMDTYLLLLAEAEILKKNEFFLSLEDLGKALKMPSDWNDTALRRQVIKTLKKLQNVYKLININLGHGKDAWIELKYLHGKRFTIKGSFINPAFLSSKSQSIKFVLLIKALLKQEERSMESFTLNELSKQFHISTETLRRAIKELDKIQSK